MNNDLNKNNENVSDVNLVNVKGQIVMKQSTHTEINNIEVDEFQELLDNPNLPFDKRWSLISEIDRSNKIYGIYKMFTTEFEKALKKNPNLKTISILDVGSGSAGLSVYLEKWMLKKGIEIEVNLYDSQIDVLHESKKKFSKSHVNIHQATSEHLKVYKENSFDFVVCLHVIHHIHPHQVAVSAIEEMHRIASKGVIVVDIDYRPAFIPMAEFINFAIGISKDLRSDGYKSMKRAYNLKNLLKNMNLITINKKFNITTQNKFFMPYWIISSFKK